MTVPNTMKIYIAGKWEDRERLDEIAGRLAAMGHTITSTWHSAKAHRQEGIDLPYDEQMKNGEWMRAEAFKDLDQIEDANVILADTFTPSTTGGRVFEMGYAFALHKHVFIIGPRRNPFDWLYETFDGWDQLFSCITRNAVNPNPMEAK